MNNVQILQQRLLNQGLAEPTLFTPQQVVSSLLAMQAQEFAMAKWAIALRLNKSTTDTEVETAFNYGEIIRNHVMRPTWHFVAPADLRWLLKLTAPRVHAFSAYMYRKEGLNPPHFNKCIKVMEKVLRDNNFLTRTAIQEAFKKSKIEAAGHTLAYIMMYAELEGIVCSGPRQGKQFTYALLEERVPEVKKLTKAEALAECARRYFASRGPATAKDMSWWSGLTVKEVKEGLHTLPKDFEKVKIDGDEYFFKPVEWEKKKNYTTTFLMPDYDEYGISYKNRSALSDPRNTHLKVGEQLSPWSHWMVINSKINGTWERDIKKKKVEVKTTLFNPLTAKEKKELKQNIEKYRRFAGHAEE